MPLLNYSGIAIPEFLRETAMAVFVPDTDMRSQVYVSRIFRFLEETLGKEATAENIAFVSQVAQKIEMQGLCTGYGDLQMRLAGVQGTIAAKTAPAPRL